MSIHTLLRKVIRPGVYGVATCNDEILLVSKGPHGIYANLLDLPGGGIEFGEDAEMTLRREFQEEVGMTFDTMKLKCNLSHVKDVHGVDPDPFAFHQIGQIYVVDGLKSIPNMSAEDEPAWYSIEKLELHKLTPFAKAIVTHLRSNIAL